MKDLKITKFIPAERTKVFTYFTRPELVEKWSAPDGMTLKVPQFEAKVGGKYRYEHSSNDGVFICTGFFKEFIPNEKLVFVDTVKGPDGKVMFENLECTTYLKEQGAGTEISITQKGFPDDEAYNSCVDGWNQCLDKLSNLLGGGVDARQGKNTSSEGRSLDHN